MKTLLSTAIVLALSCHSAMADVAMGPFPGHHAPSFEQLLEKFDINQDGTISQDEVQSVHQAFFKAGDTNADGFLTEAELATVHAQQRETRLAEEFAELDTNGDGGISSEEAASQVSPGPGRHLARYFTEVDSNGDGLATLEEMKTMIQGREASMVTPHQQMQQQRFTRLDNNGDGLVSLTEFTFNLPIFDRLDANEDGIITSEEAALRQPTGRPQFGKKGNGQRPNRPQ